MTRFRLSRHVQQELILKRIPRELLDSVCSAPQQVIPSRLGRKVYQSLVEFETGKQHLLRVIVDEATNPAVVVTVYRTSKIQKYWRQP